MASRSATGLRALQTEYNELINDEPLDGLRLNLFNGYDMFHWELIIIGPPGGIYQGGYYKARMHFPVDYPHNPPTLRFDSTTCPFHPNVDENGYMRISILNPVANDPDSALPPNPVQSARMILTSVISSLNEPDMSIEPVNTEASELYNRWKESNGRDNQYELNVKQQVAASRLQAERDGIDVPPTLEEEALPQARASIIPDDEDTDDDHEDENNLQDSYSHYIDDDD